MMIPLGFLGVTKVPADFELISTTVLAATAASVTFSVSGLGSTYKHLQIRAVARTNRASTVDNIQLRFNGDSSAIYSEHSLAGMGTSAAAGTAGTSATFAEVGLISGASATASAFGLAIIDIMDPFSGTKNTTTRALSGVHQLVSSNYGVGLYGGNWRSTAAVTSIALAPENGPLFDVGSRFSIYGIKG